jgi:hypothetical protein
MSQVIVYSSDVEQDTHLCDLYGFYQPHHHSFHNPYVFTVPAFSEVKTTVGVSGWQNPGPMSMP